MDLEYFKTQINAELEGAEDYYGRASAMSGTSYEPAFKDMSNQELSHAKKLLSMMESCISNMKTAYDELSSKYKQTEEMLNE